MAEESPPNETPDTGQDTPADALSRTPDDLAEEHAANEAEHPAESAPAEHDHVSPVKRFFRRANIYLLLFGLLVVIAAVITVVNYLNSQKEPEIPSAASQDISEEALQQLAQTDASVGSSAQTLTIQGNAVIDGQTLMRGDLSVASGFQTGGAIQGAELTISGGANIGETQANSLQVAGDTAIQGTTTLRNLSVSGTGSFSGALQASQLTVSRLILSGSGTLEVPNHLGFTGPSPTRTINSTALGGGGTASVNGSDTSGSVNINSGNNPSSGCLVRINFRQAYSSAPRVVISPVGSGAGAMQYYVDRNASGFSICSNNAAPANRGFAFDYFVAS